MIEIDYNDRKVRIVGHAGYAEKGEDIVCAAISGLWYALLGKLEKERENGIVDFSSEEEPGYAKVCIEWVAKGYEEYLAEWMDTIMTGMEMMSKQYPENVLVKNV